MPNEVSRIVLKEEMRPRLQKKLEEYESRLLNLEDPDYDTSIKIATLRRLLLNKSVDLLSLSRELQDANPYWALNTIKNAYAVIDAYNEDQLQNVEDGTGLPEA